MYYSLVGILATAILFIVNQDILFGKHSAHQIPAHTHYRLFLYAVVLYYVTDIMWGIFDSYGLVTFLYIDTVIYFIAMALGVWLWTRFVTRYLGRRNIWRKLLAGTGMVFFWLEIIALIINFFYPVMFSFDAEGAYHHGFLRSALLIVQILMFLLTSVYSLIIRYRAEDAKRRYRTIGFFGLIMAALITIQLWYPLMPLYSMGYMLGTCLLHSFVIEDEKEKYRSSLEDALSREKKQKVELDSARSLVYTDPLTGVKSKLAFIEAEARLDREIADGTGEGFSLAVFDMNGLKVINDTKGHEQGDKYLVEGAEFICRSFPGSPVFRIGGDEFAAVLEGENNRRRASLTAEFNRTIENNLKNGGIIVSIGVAEYFANRDKDVRTVFERADHQMYRRKHELKEMAAG